MNGPRRELEGRGSPLIAAPGRPTPLPGLTSGPGTASRAGVTKPRPTGRRAPHGAPAHTLVRTLVLPNKEPQP
jgi:hypothetical protein